MTKPLITHVLWTLGRGGAERLVLVLLERLRASGAFEVQVVAAGGGGEMQVDFEAAGIPLRIGPSEGGRKATRAFLRACFQESRPALLHTHLGADLWAGWIANRQGIRPWVSTQHNVDVDERWSLHKARGWMLRRADRVVCVSECVREYIQKDFGLSAQHLSVIRLGLDWPTEAVRPPRACQDVPHFLSIGRLAEQKDHATLIRGLAALSRPWRLTILGEGPKRAELERLIEEHHLKPRVHLVGGVRDVKPYLLEADVFCFSSRWEGQGYALLEAAAAGVPIVASDLPVFREAFDDGSVAFAPASRPESWTRVIRDVLGDYFKALRRSEMAREIVRRQFSISQMVSSYAVLYEQLLSSHAHSSRQ